MKGASQPGDRDPFSHPTTAALVRAALAEDVGRGDATTLATIAHDARGRARLVAREDCVVAGMPLVGMVYEALEPGAISVRQRVREGARVRAGRNLADLEGSLRTLLAGERVSLNLVQQLCATATLTRRFTDAVAGTGAEILDTRKTIVGLRLLQKYAVRVGGGRNHRFGLDDGILIKDNHVAACGSIEKAVGRARAAAAHGLRIEVECDHVEQVEPALRAGADVLLLDNMTPAMVGRVRKMVGPDVVLEVSGGIGLNNVRKFAERSANLISVGRLTHSAGAIDLAMDVVQASARRRSGSA